MYCLQDLVNIAQHLLKTIKRGGDNMFPNLKAEMARLGIDMKDLSELTGIKYSTLNAKMSGKREFTLWECIKIKNALNVDLSLDYLFERKREE